MNLFQLFGIYDNCIIIQFVQIILKLWSFFFCLNFHRRFSYFGDSLYSCNHFTFSQWSNTDVTPVCARLNTEEVSQSRVAAGAGTVILVLRSAPLPKRSPEQVVEASQMVLDTVGTEAQLSTIVSVEEESLIRKCPVVLKCLKLCSRKTP